MAYFIKFPLLTFYIQKEMNVSASCFKKFFQSILEDKWDKVHSFTDHTPDKKKYIESTISFWSHFIGLNSKEIFGCKGMLIKVTDQVRPLKTGLFSKTKLPVQPQMLQ